MKTIARSTSAVLALLAALFILSACEKKAGAPETPTGVGSGFPDITDREPDVSADAEVMLHVIVTTSENPFALEPIVKRLTTKASAVKNPFGEGGSFSGAVFAKAVEALDLPEIIEIRLHNIADAGDENPMGDASTIIESVDDGATLDSRGRCGADAAGNLHAFVVVQIAK